MFAYEVLERFWREAEDLGFHGVWNYDHFYGIRDLDQPTHEGWTTLAAMAALTSRARIGCMVTGVTYRHPALLANMAVTVDHISGGRLDVGIGAAWHEPEHTGYGIPFPSAGARVSMLDEACEIMRRLWTQERVSHEGRFFTLNEARCSPKPVQERLPMTIGASGPRMMRVVARHADQWNAPSLTLPPDRFRERSAELDDRCREAGRDPAEVARSVQLFVFPDNPDEMRKVPDLVEGYDAAGCEHIVFSFYSPPSREQMRTLAP